MAIIPGATYAFDLAAYYEVEAGYFPGQTEPLKLRKACTGTTPVEIRIPPANPPAGPSATATSSTTVHLEWDPVDGADHYRIYRTSDGGQNWTVIADGVTGTVYDDTTCSPGLMYQYSVQAINSGGESECSTASNEAHTTDWPDVSEFVWGSSGEVKVEGNVIRVGVAGRKEDDGQPADVHGIAMRLPELPTGVSEYTVSFNYDLHTWDSYCKGPGYWDSFSVSVTSTPYALLEQSDPLQLPFVWGGKTWGDGSLEATSGSESIHIPVSGPGPHFLNIVLDTRTSNETDGDYPSWGTFTLLSPLVGVDLAVGQLTEDQEEAAGGFMAVNDDFDEGNKDASGNPLPDNQGTPRIIGSGDSELLGATLQFPGVKGVKGKWKLTFPNKIKVWREEGGTFTEVVSGQESAELTLPLALPVKLWIEGMSASAAKNDVEIKATFTPTGNMPASEDKALLTVIGTDLAIDSNNDGSLTAADDAIEDDNTKPGKILPVNDDDTDGDGIVDWADGFNWSSTDDPQDDVIAGEQFVPLTLTLPQGLDFSQVRIRFNYDASDPDAVGTNGPNFTLPAGSLRLWTKNGHEARSRFSIAYGGDYIAKNADGQGYTAAQLGLSSSNRTVTLWAEAVRASASLGDKQIQVSIDLDGDGPSGFIAADAVRATSIGWKLQQVNSDNSLTSIDYPELSYPTPTLSGVSFSVSNLRFNADYTGILGDIHVAGSLDDAASDLIPGLDGIIDSVQLYLNGSTVPLATIATDVTKVTRSSLLKPFDFSATFDTILAGIPLEPGWNQFHLTAKNANGFSGFAEGAVEVNVQAPPDDIGEVELTFSYSPSAASADSIQARVQINNGGWTTYQFTETGAGTRRFESPGGVFVVQLNAVGAFDPNAPDSFTGNVFYAPFSNIFGSSVTWTEKANDTDPLGNNTKVFEGIKLITEDDRLDYEWYLVTAGSVSPITASAGGSLNPFLIQLDGPAELFTPSTTITIDVPSDDRIYKPVKYNGLPFLASLDSDMPRPLFTAADLNASPFPEELQPRDGVPNALAGFGVGLTEAGMGVWDGVKGVGQAAWYVIRNYNPWSISWRLGIGDGVVTVEDKKRISAAAGVATTLWNIASKIITDQADFVASALVGDDETIIRLGEEYRTVFEYSAEVLQALNEHMLEMSDYDFGRIVGRVLGETLVAVGTAGAGSALKGVTMTNVITKIKALPFVAKYENVVAKLDQLLVLMRKVSETRMCFVAGTLVHTAVGLKAIETIRHGDMVLSRDQATGEQTYKPVVQTFTTHPDALYHLQYDPDGSGPLPQQELVTTAPHPFWVINADAFVAAEDLKLGDQFLLADGRAAELIDIEVEQAALGQSFTTYNFEVADFHTYFVGENGVWVHNAAGRECERIFSLFRRVMTKGLFQK